MNPPLDRRFFPVVERCIYLNNNSTGAIHAGAQSVLQRYYETLCDWRDDAVESWWSELQAYRTELEGFIGAPSGTVVTDANLSTLLGRLLTCVDFNRGREKILTTDLAFPTIPFIARAFRRYGAKLVTVKTDGRSIDENQLAESIDENTAIVCLSHASFTTGSLTDIRFVAERAHAVGAWVVIDAYQSLGIVPVDVEALDCDFLLGGAHKWLCGSFEMGFLYARKELIPSLEPAATGWIAGDNPLSFSDQIAWAPDARRLEAGTPLILPAMLSRPGLAALRSAGMGKVRQHSLDLTLQIMNRAEQDDLEVLTPRPSTKRAGTVAVQFPNAETACARLAAKGFVVSYRGALRIAPHGYNTSEEIDQFMDALIDVRKELE